MEDQTFFLDGKEGNKNHKFWGFQLVLGAIFFVQGFSGISDFPYGLSFLHLFQFAFGTIILCTFAFMLISRWLFGRMFVTFDAPGLTIKAKRWGPPLQVSWEEITGIRYSPNKVVITSADEYQKPITIKTGTYDLSRKVKETFQEYVASREIDIEERLK